MRAIQISRHWRERRHPVAVETAIKAFLAIRDPIEAVRVACEFEAAGANGPQRFLLDCEGYLSNPGLWRQQARARHRKRVKEWAESAAAIRDEIRERRRDVIRFSA